MTRQESSQRSQQAIAVLMKLAQYVELLGHVPGRITMSIPLMHLPKLISFLQGVDLDKEVGSLPGYKNHTISLFSRSATIYYDPSVIPYDLWEDYCAIKTRPQFAKAVSDRLWMIFNDGRG
jgi:hypothetical protein